MSIRTAYIVEGMTCDHCVRSVRQEVAAVAGVHAVEVDLATGELIVVSDRPLDSGVVRTAVEEAGYDLADR